MTLQERQIAAKAEADRLLQERAQAQQVLGRLHEDLVRVDAQLALLEMLIADAVVPQEPPLSLVPKRGRKPREEKVG